MAIFGNIKIPGFIADGESLLLPEGSRVALKDKSSNPKWALYVNDSLNLSWLAMRAYYQGVLGWKIISFTSIVNVQFVNEYVKSCSQCLENF